MDGRSGKQLEYIIDRIGFDRYVSIIGGQPDTGFLPNKILWYKENEPELFAKTIAEAARSAELPITLSTSRRSKKASAMHAERS